MEVSIFLTDIHDFKQVNEIYATIFREPIVPAVLSRSPPCHSALTLEIEAVIAI